MRLTVLQPFVLAALASTQVLGFHIALPGKAVAGTPLDSTAAGACFWSGTAPFCDGSCLSGYTEEATDGCGDGACCVTGYKKKCCKTSLVEATESRHLNNGDDDPNDDYCPHDKYIMCPPGATKNEECECLDKDQKAGSRQSILRHGHI